VEEALPYKDVFVWRPRVGKFRHAKTFWLEILLRNFCNENWCITVDGDEFISLPGSVREEPRGLSPMRALVEFADKHEMRYFCGFLLDLIPGESRKNPTLKGSDFTHYQFLGNSPDKQ